MTDPDLPTGTEGEGETLDLPEGLSAFSKGQILGERYRILELLGRGGMGEVWHAFDLKLRVEVALKALRSDLFKSERRLELLRQEVRAAREVVSPNVCRIFDLVEVEGRELVSMEYVDGATLLAVLTERGPLELKEAQDVASQFLAGLEAIHKVGLIHRDIKPENIMLTRAGRVVVMDFGLARQETEGGGSVSGTPAYMAPEQAAGQQLDARADVYAAGVVLAEMVSPDGIKNLTSRQSVWEGVRSEPAQVPDSPWAAVIKKAVAKDREGRYNSAHTLTRALEDVTLRVEGADDLHPYPGLASFTEDDAEYFFGREAEVEAMWRKLEGPPRMLALVGPSGAGKTSFLQAGLIPAATAGWASVLCTPGADPRAALRRAVISELEGDTEALRELAEGSDAASVSAVARWSRHHQHAVVVVDQFEELFTQNASDEQHRFAVLLGRLVLEADVFVLLSMRDDFLIHCNRHESLRPLFSELTPLDPPAGVALRRALTQPALQCGYRFEDDELVEEMLAEVEGERGALPLLAFAAARLWERRNRETGLLTRQAYEDIGGVGGSLARHAEATIDQIGHERLPIVRELFRNLVTAEGTRAVREWDELLSVFSDSRSESQSEDVLRQLIDARLLTSYEVREGDEAPTRRVEIIHESLLANWPRLVRWRTQDQEGAQLRDELRQAARAWDEHGRHDDRLWSGTAFREYQLWRERYPGGLTEIEEEFAAAMTSAAMRRRRRRQLAVSGAFAAVLVVLAVFGLLWQRSVREAHRAEAANLVSLGQLELESYPSATVAYTIASLEMADGSSARRLALEALCRGPIALVAANNVDWGHRFSPDGRSLVQQQLSPEGDEGHIGIFHADGTRDYLEDKHSGASWVGMSSISDTGHFLSFGPDTESSVKYVVWSAIEKKPLAETSLEGIWEPWSTAVDSKRRRAVIVTRDGDRITVDSLGFDGTHTSLGALDFELVRNEAGRWTTVATLDPRTGQQLAVVSVDDVYVVDVGDHDLGRPRFLGRHANALPSIAFDPRRRFVATSDEDGEFRFWHLSGSSPPIVFQGPPNSSFFDFVADGSLFEAATTKDGNWLTWVWEVSTSQPRFLRRFNLGGTGTSSWRWDTIGDRLAGFGGDGPFQIWSIDAPFDADPVILRRGDIGQGEIEFDPQGDWLATGDEHGLALWPLRERFPTVIRRHDGHVHRLTFAPDGSWLASSSSDGTVRLWPLGGRPPPPGRSLLELDTSLPTGLASSPDGELILAGTFAEGARLLSPGDEAPRNLEGFKQLIGAVAFSPDGRLAAAAGGQFIPADRVIRIWDVATGEEITSLEIGEQPIVSSLKFISDEHLLAISESGLVQWNINTGQRELVYGKISDELIRYFDASNDGRRVLMNESDSVKEYGGKAVFMDLDSGTVIRLDRFGDDVFAVALNSAGTLAVTSDLDGEVRVGPVTGEDPHLLLGHEGLVRALAIDPRGRWIASGGDDSTIRLWPMPDLSKPPLHTLPREELIAKLKSLTNLRAVRDAESPTGWKIEAGPFPGWAEVPEW